MKTDVDLSLVVKLMDTNEYEKANKLLNILIESGDELKIRETLVSLLIKAGGCYEAYDECIYIIKNLLPSHMTYMHLQNISFWLKKYDELKVYSQKRMQITKELGDVSAQSQVAYCMACIYLREFTEVERIYNTIKVDDKNSELILFCEKKMYYTSKSRILRCIESKNDKELLSLI